MTGWIDSLLTEKGTIGAHTTRQTALPVNYSTSYSDTAGHQFTIQTMSTGIGPVYYGFAKAKAEKKTVWGRFVSSISSLAKTSNSRQGHQVKRKVGVGALAYSSDDDSDNEDNDGEERKPLLGTF